MFMPGLHLNLIFFSKFLISYLFLLWITTAIIHRYVYNFYFAPNYGGLFLPILKKFVFLKKIIFQYLCLNFQLFLFSFQLVWGFNRG